MKKTLTVNLGGTVYHIDEDAYQLLDQYLANLKLHFRKEVGAEEILNDMEIRISELFTEKVSAGFQVISIEYVEEVIARMGKPEELPEAEAGSEESATGETSRESHKKQEEPVHRRFFRNSDDMILGGVASGFAAYMGWDTTAVRLLMLLLLILGHGVVVIIYIILWISIPLANTAAEKLAMRGERVTVENIGKTVTDGFEKVADGVNKYVKSGKPRTTLQKIGDVIVQIIGVCIKVILVLLALLLCPVLFALIFALLVLISTAVSIVLGGGIGLLGLLPVFNDSVIVLNSPGGIIWACIVGIVLVGIPLAGLVYAIFKQLFGWKPMSLVVKITLSVLWLISLVISIFLFPTTFYPFWHHYVYSITV